MYEIYWTDGSLSNGYLSEAEAVREALDHDDPQAEIVWETEKESCGTAIVCAEELGLLSEEVA